MTDKNRHNPALSGKQSQAIPAILAAKSITAGCRKAGINRDTFYSWLKTPAFKAEFERQRKEIIDLALHELRGLTGQAVEVLRRLLKAKSEVVRLRTAMGIIESVLKAKEAEKNDSGRGQLDELIAVMRAGHRESGRGTSNV